MAAAESDSDATSDPVVVILFMFFGLGMGIIIMQVLSAMGEPIPYTCVVFATGIIFSLGTKGDGGKHQKNFAWFLDSYKRLTTFFRHLHGINQRLGQYRRRLIALCFPAPTDLW